MSYLYEHFKFEIPVGTHNKVQVISENTKYELYVNNILWFVYDSKTQIAIKEFITQFTIAKGNVVTTGLGLGLREQILLYKPEVTSLTIIEKSKDLIDFHLQHSKWIKDPKVKIVNIDAGNFKESCDVLLLDHYEQQNYMAILNNVINISNKIDCKTMWFWPFEVYIIANGKKRNLNFIDSYKDLKDRYNLNKFPNLSEVEINDSCRIFDTQILEQGIDTSQLSFV